MLHEALLEIPKHQGFISKNETVGWTQGPHGTSRPVIAVVVGREMRGITTLETGELKVRAQTYVIATGNEHILSSLPHTKSNPQGWRENEFEITENFSPEYAFKLSYSQDSPSKLAEGVPYTLTSFIENSLLKQM
jgi:hypothetical protein